MRLQHVADDANDYGGQNTAASDDAVYDPAYAAEDYGALDLAAGEPRRRRGRGASTPRTGRADAADGSRRRRGFVGRRGSVYPHGRSTSRPRRLLQAGLRTA